MPMLRAGAMTVAAATGLLALASTGQTPSGFVPAALGGPLGVFQVPAEASMAGVMAIGDGTADAGELADLLKTIGPSTVPTGPQTPDVLAAGNSALSAAALAPTAQSAEVVGAPTSKQSLSLKPVLDGNGRVNCSEAISCETDPTTNITTVTYSDGVVAIVQRINDLTLVAYKTVGDVISGSIDALLPRATSALPAAAVPPKPVLAPAPPVVASPPTPQVPDIVVAKPQAPSVSAGPVAPSAPAGVPDLSAADVRPQLTISKPPSDFDAPATGGSSDAPKLPSGTLNTVKDAVGSVVDAVTDAVKAIGPSASTQEPADGSEGAGAQGAN